MSDDFGEDVPPAQMVEAAIDALCMKGVVGPGGTLPSSWVVIADVGDVVQMYVDRHSRSYQTLGLMEYAKLMVSEVDFSADYEPE